jgi:hypothetical protein
MSIEGASPRKEKQEKLEEKTQEREVFYYSHVGIRDVPSGTSVEDISSLDILQLSEEALKKIDWYTVNREHLIAVIPVLPETIVDELIDSLIRQWDMSHYKWALPELEKRCSESQLVRLLDSQNSDFLRCKKISDKRKQERFHIIANQEGVDSVQAFFWHEAMSQLLREQVVRFWLREKEIMSLLRYKTEIDALLRSEQITDQRGLRNEVSQCIRETEDEYVQVIYADFFEAGASKLLNCFDAVITKRMQPSSVRPSVHSDRESIRPVLSRLPADAIQEVLAKNNALYLLAYVLEDIQGEYNYTAIINDIIKVGVSPLMLEQLSSIPYGAVDKEVLISFYSAVADAGKDIFCDYYDQLESTSSAYRLGAFLRENNYSEIILALGSKIEISGKEKKSMKDTLKKEERYDLLLQHIDVFSLDMAEQKEYIELASKQGHGLAFFLPIMDKIAPGAFSSERMELMVYNPNREAASLLIAHYNKLVLHMSRLDILRKLQHSGYPQKHPSVFFEGIPYADCKDIFLYMFKSHSSPSDRRSWIQWLNIYPGVEHESEFTERVIAQLGITDVLQAECFGTLEVMLRCAPEKLEGQLDVEALKKKRDVLLNDGRNAAGGSIGRCIAMLTGEEDYQSSHLEKDMTSREVMDSKMPVHETALQFYIEEYIQGLLNVIQGVEDWRERLPFKDRMSLEKIRSGIIRHQEEFQSFLADSILFLSSKERNDAFSDVFQKSKAWKPLSIEKGETHSLTREEILRRFASLRNDFQSSSVSTGGYGGPPWRAIVEAGYNLSNPANSTRRSVLIDHVMDLQHNSGFLFSEVKRRSLGIPPRAAKVLKTLLDLKRVDKDPMHVLDEMQYSAGSELIDQLRQKVVSVRKIASQLGHELAF